jgi:hypothetical protein
MLDDQDVIGALAGDQELGVITLGMQCVCGDHAPGQVQVFQQRGEPGDLIGLAVHAGLPEDGDGLLVDDRQQVRGLPVAGGVPGAPHRLAVHGQRPPGAPAAPGSLVSRPQPPGEPGSHRGVERVGVDGFQDPADGGLIRWLEPAGQRITADPETGQDLRRRVGDPLAEGRERPRPRQHRRHRCH